MPSVLILVSGITQDLELRSESLSSLMMFTLNQVAPLSADPDFGSTFFSAGHNYLCNVPSSVASHSVPRASFDDFY
jgi:hypothetical protein